MTIPQMGEVETTWRPGRTIEVHNLRWPGGVGVRPPSPEHPYWRTAGGERTSLGSVLAGAPASEQLMVLGAHAAAIEALVRAAGAERLAERGREARRLAGAASRLCGELIGHWPERSWEPLGR